MTRTISDLTAEAARRRERKTEGLCPRCESPLRGDPEINALTGRPLLRDGVPVIVTTCSANCGYVYRPKARSRR